MVWPRFGSALCVSALGLALAACASGAPIADARASPRGTDEVLAERVFDASEIEEPPELLGCAYEGPTRGTRWVEVTFVVDRTGAVEEASVAPTDWSVRTSQRLVERALRIASSCRYRPGRIAGGAVRVRVDRVFRFRR